MPHVGGASGRLRLGLRLGSRCRCAAGYGGARGVACRLHVLRWDGLTGKLVPRYRLNILGRAGFTSDKPLFEILQFDLLNLQIFVFFLILEHS